MKGGMTSPEKKKIKRRLTMAQIGSLQEQIAMCRRGNFFLSFCEFNGVFRMYGFFVRFKQELVCSTLRMLSGCQIHSDMFGEIPLTFIERAELKSAYFSLWCSFLGSFLWVKTCVSNFNSFKLANFRQNWQWWMPEPWKSRQLKWLSSDCTPGWRSTMETLANCADMGVSKNSGTPKWMVYNGKYQNGWFGGTTI